MWWLLVLLAVLVAEGGSGGRKVLVPDGGFSRAELTAAASSLRVPPSSLLVAIVLCSERARSLPLARAHQAELLAIAHTVWNRVRTRAFGADFWQVVMGNRTRTGETGPPFATTVVPQGELLGELLDLADLAAREQAAGVTRGGVLAYHHHTGEKAIEINAIWSRRGYVQVLPPDVLADDATFFAASPDKARALTT